jgi:hypothetical protein
MYVHVCERRERHGFKSFTLSCEANGTAACPGDQCQWKDEEDEQRQMTPDPDSIRVCVATEREGNEGKRKKKNMT